jgi:hypothetical protein
MGRIYQYVHFAQSFSLSSTSCDASTLTSLRQAPALMQMVNRWWGRSVGRRIETAACECCSDGSAAGQHIRDQRTRPSWCSVHHAQGTGQREWPVVRCIDGHLHDNVLAQRCLEVLRTLTSQMIFPTTCATSLRMMVTESLPLVHKESLKSQKQEQPHGRFRPRPSSPSLHLRRHCLG